MKKPLSKYTSIIAWGGDVNLGRQEHFLTERYDINNVLNIAALKEANFTIVNLECVVSTLGMQGQDKKEGRSYCYRARPEMVEILRNAGVDAVACANNHSGDYGPEALMQQSEILKAAGIIPIGIGQTRAEAFAPIYHQLPNAVKVAVFNVDATQLRYSVKNNKAGAAFLHLMKPDTWTNTYTSLFEEARKQADIVLVAIHWGAHGRATPDDNEIEVGHRLIDAGADAVLGASAHVLQGVEIYQGKPIIHDAGDLLFDPAVATPKPAGVFHLNIGRKGIEKVIFHPIGIESGYTSATTGDNAIEASRQFAAKCMEMGTTAVLHEDGLLSIDTEPSLVRNVSKNQIVDPNPILDNQTKEVDYSQWSAEAHSDLIIHSMPKDDSEQNVTTGASIQVESFTLNNGVISNRKVLNSVNPEVKKPMASLAKLMTVILVWDKVRAENIDPINTLVTVSTDKFHSSSEQYSFYEKNEQVTLLTLIQSVLIASSDEGAYSLATWHSGSEEAFVVQMNQRSKEMGLSQTNWLSSSGLDESAYTTAQDMCVVAKVFISEYSDVASNCALRTFKYNGKKVNNTNKLMPTYTNIMGLKTGDLVGVVANLVNYWIKEDTHYISVVLGAKSKNRCNKLSRRLMDSWTL